MPETANTDTGWRLHYRPEKGHYVIHQDDETIAVLTDEQAAIMCCLAPQRLQELTAIAQQLSELSTAKMTLTRLRAALRTLHQFADISAKRTYVLDSGRPHPR